MIERETAARAVAARLAVNRAALGRRYAEWLASAAGREAPPQVAALAREEAEQAQTFAGLAGLTTPEAGGDAVAFLDVPLRTWLDIVAVRLIFDGAMRVVLAAALGASVADLAAAARESLRREHQRVGRTDGWARRLGGEGGQRARGLEAAVLRFWDESLCWLGPQGDPLAESCYTEGVLDAMPNVLRTRLLGYIGPIARGAGLRLPVRPAAQGNTWELTMPLPWARWDAARWRFAAA